MNLFNYKIKLIKLISLVLLSGHFCTAFSQPKNEIPLYGEQPKTKDEIEFDNKFIKEATEAAGSREKAFNQIMEKAWNALSMRATSEATRRFNQAYLLNPKDYQVYWGLGIVSGIKNNLSQAESLFEKAYKLKQNDPRLLCDYGHALVGLALALPSKPESEKPIVELFIRAEKKYKEAIKIDSKLALPYSRLAMLDFYRGNFKDAWNNVKLSEERGGEGLDQAFLADLNKVSPKEK